MRAIGGLGHHFGMQTGRIEARSLEARPGSVSEDAVEQQRDPLFVSEVGESVANMVEKRHDHIHGSART